MATTDFLIFVAGVISIPELFLSWLELFIINLTLTLFLQFWGLECDISLRVICLLVVLGPKNRFRIILKILLLLSLLYDLSFKLEDGLLTRILIRYLIINISELLPETTLSTWFKPLCSSEINIDVSWLLVERDSQCCTEVFLQLLSDISWANDLWRLFNIRRLWSLGFDLLVFRNVRRKRRNNICLSYLLISGIARL